MNEENEPNDIHIFDEEVPGNNESTSSGSKGSEVENLKSAANELPNSTASPPRQEAITNRLFTLERPNNVGYLSEIFTKCTLNSLWDPCVYDAGQTVERPAGFVFRTGQEVFVCGAHRPNSLKAVFLLMGIVKHPENKHLYSSAILFSPSVEKRTPLEMFKAVPLIYVARLPGGRASPQTDEDMTEANQMIIPFFAEVLKSGKPLQQFDIAPPEKMKRHSTRSSSASEGSITFPQKKGTATFPPPTKLLLAASPVSSVHVDYDKINKHIDSSLAKALKPISKLLEDLTKSKNSKSSSCNEKLELKIQQLTKDNEILKVQLSSQTALANEFKEKFFECAQTLATNSNSFANTQKATLGYRPREQLRTTPPRTHRSSPRRSSQTPNSACYSLEQSPAEPANSDDNDDFKSQLLQLLKKNNKPSNNRKSSSKRTRHSY